MCRGWVAVTGRNRRYLGRSGRWATLLRSMRRLPTATTLLTCAFLALGPAHALAQGGAGDDQYQDPFGSSGSPAQSGQSGSGSGSPSQGSAARGGSQPPLTQRPRTDLGAGPTSASGTKRADSASAQAAPANGRLPNTGLSVPGIAALGLGLLVAGIGLRLRTVDDQLF